MQKKKNFASFVSKNRLLCHQKTAETGIGTKPIFPYFYPSGNDVGRSGLSLSLFANAGMLLLPWGQHRKKGLGEKRSVVVFPDSGRKSHMSSTLFPLFSTKFLYKIVCTESEDVKRN